MGDLTRRERDPLRAYVAGSSTGAEIERVEGVASTLIAYGVEVVSTWPSVVRSQSDPNPPHASRWERRTWTERCLGEVISSHVVLFLVPRAYPTRGAWVELGVGWAHGKHLVCSGPTSSSIFCALAEEFDSDLDAISHVVALARRHER